MSRYFAVSILLFLLSGCGLFPTSVTRSTPTAPVYDHGRPTQANYPDIRTTEPQTGTIATIDDPLVSAEAVQGQQTAQNTTGETSSHQGTQVAVITPESPSQGSAVDSLLERAEKERKAGNLSAAAAVLERGVRIKPRSAILWNRLANIRLQQGEYEQAAQLAYKSNQFASGTSMKRSNYSIIARAKDATGDTTGAQIARDKAGQIL